MSQVPQACHSISGDFLSPEYIARIQSPHCGVHHVLLGTVTNGTEVPRSPPKTLPVVHMRDQTNAWKKAIHLLPTTDPPTHTGTHISCCVLDNFLGTQSKTQTLSMRTIIIHFHIIILYIQKMLYYLFNLMIFLRLPPSPPSPHSPWLTGQLLSWAATNLASIHRQCR